MLNRIEEVGRYFGYPICCIHSFNKMLETGLKTAEQANPKVHKYFGFIPCPSHAKQILEGKLRLEDLIINRACPLPFPEEPPMETLDKYLSRKVANF